MNSRILVLAVVLSCTALLPPARAVAVTPEAAASPASGELAANFASPPPTARPWVC